MRRRSLVPAAFVLGMALSGFADGILLHQVLQWHHFLSLVPGQTFRDLRVQVFADGLFHVFVYCVTALGLWLLWGRRDALDAPGAGRRFIGGLLLGFGVWNVIDVGVFHWVLGIHRIRVGVPHPMAYDLVWFLGLGCAVAAVGKAVLGRNSGRGKDGRLAAITSVALLLLSVPVANRAPADGNTLVLFRPGTSAGEAINAIVAADGGIIMLDPEGSFALVRLAPDAAVSQLYRGGAFLVTRSPLVAGCLAFTRV